MAVHAFNIFHYNPSGRVQRGSISCRREHSNSPAAGFVPGFDSTGMPESRQGYHVACNTHSDCLTCGRHPLTGQHYRCQKIHTLYDTVHTDDDGITFLNLTSGSSDAFDIDMADAAINGKSGVCVDYDSSMNEGCSNRYAAIVKDGLIGCTDEVASKWMCGLALEIKHGDLSTVALTGNIFWPRVLLDGSEDRDGDGVSDQHMECTDPIGTPLCILEPLTYSNLTHEAFGSNTQTEFRSSA
tara:strand:- start:12 stop:734 length:723 start_codon:yes stop_codon:yes gene_type:complete